MSFVDYFVIIILIVVILFYIKKYYGEIEYVKSKIDGRYYLVRKLSDKQGAADFLASINQDCIKLIKYLVAKHPNNRDIRRLDKNFNPDSISEGSADSGYTSYSVNKGEKIILCLRQKQSNEFVAKNVVMYVTLHELAHLMTSEIGHTKQFWDNFKFIAEEAVEFGVYDKVDYSKSPVKYCGIKITSSII